MPILIVVTWQLFPPFQAFVVSLLEIAVIIVEYFFKRNPGNIKSTVSFIASVVVITPLLLVIASRVLQVASGAPAQIPAEIWQAIVDYFAVFDQVSSLTDFGELVSDLFAK